MPFLPQSGRLQRLHDELEMDTVILHVTLAAPDVIKLLAPVDFEACTLSLIHI